MTAATEEDIPALIRILAGNLADLFKRDAKGRTALDLARMGRKYFAVSLITKVSWKYGISSMLRNFICFLFDLFTKAMNSELSDRRLDLIGSSKQVEDAIRRTNLSQSKRLFIALRSRRSELAKRILNDNKLYREEVEALGEVYFTDYIGHSGYTPLILAAGINFLEVRTNYSIIFSGEHHSTMPTGG